MATITNKRGQWHFIGTLFFDVSVDNNASVFYPAGVAITEANADILTADDLAGFVSLMLVAQAAAFTGTITVAVLDNTASDYTLDASWRTLQSPPATDVAIVADKAIVIDTALAAPALRLESSGAEAGDRTLYLYGRRGNVN